MVDAVRDYFKQQGMAPQNFYYEKFSNTGLVTETGEEHLTVAASDEAFDAKLALELGVASLVLGKLTADQLAEQAAPILFPASDEASCIVGSTLPVGGGDLRYLF